MRRRARRPKGEGKALRHGAQLTMPWAATRPPMTDAVAHPRRDVKPELSSRWTPQYVYTLHRVPGRLDGPPLAVRRRVLRDEESITVETPGGTTSVSSDDLSDPKRGGRACSYGSTRADFRKEPPPWGYGWDLQIEIFDHVPTIEERERWMAVRRGLSAMLAKTPRHAYLAFPSVGSRYVVEKVQLRRPENLSDFGHRLDLKFRRQRGEWQSELCCPNLYELAEQGWSSVGHQSHGTRLYLAMPPQAELDQLGREHAERVAKDAQHKREAEAFFNAIRGVVDPAAKQRSEGLAALRKLGLAEGATAADVQRVFRERAKAEHPDVGGAGDMGELVRLRDLALGAVA